MGALPPDHQRLYIPDGKAGTAATIQKMQEMISTGKRNFQVREMIGQVIAHCPQKDYTCYATAWFNYCRDKIKYVFDPNGVELVEAPQRILKSKIADCDSICVLLNSGFESMGFPTRLVTGKADSQRPDEYSHVWAQVNVPKRGWVTADATMSHDFGWAPPPSIPITIWNGSNDPSEDHEGDKMAGLADFQDETLLDPMGQDQLEMAPWCGSCKPYEGVARDTDFFVQRGWSMSGLDADVIPMAKPSVPIKILLNEDATAPDYFYKQPELTPSEMLFRQANGSYVFGANPEQLPGAGWAEQQRQREKTMRLIGWSALGIVGLFMLARMR